MRHNRNTKKICDGCDENRKPMYKFTLDKTSRKYTCPKCHKKTFVRYVDSETKRFVHSDVGRCDRAINCAFHYSPKAYFNDNPSEIVARNARETVKRNEKRNVPEQLFQNVSFIEKDVFLKSFSSYGSNNFVLFLKQKFEADVVEILVNHFGIGTSIYWKGATFFWQVDENEKIRSGKIIVYDKNTGKRTKHISWVHSVLKLKNFKLKQCLFGLHQIKYFPDHIIGIVESEKTAIILSGISMQQDILNGYIWLATGSINMLKEELLIPIKSRRIVLFPDTGTDINKNGSPYFQWKQKSAYLNHRGFNIKISRLLEDIASPEEISKGCDLADFVILK